MTRPWIMGPGSWALSDHIGRDADGDHQWQQPPDFAKGRDGTAFAFVMGKGAKANGIFELSLLHIFAFF